MNNPLTFHPVVPLRLLRQGEGGEIEEIVGDHFQVKRLAEMGVRSGVPIEVLTAGTPCIAAVAGQRFCLRGSENLEVMVRRGSTR